MSSPAPLTESHAHSLDARDPLANCRDLFNFPKKLEQQLSTPIIYMAGNSLGLMPRTASSAVQQELEDWASLAVEGHFEAKNPWVRYHELLREMAARLVGANPSEVVMMNTLTVNLHLMMISFYRPTPQRHRILIEDDAFPSDSYAVASQIRLHGFQPETSLIRLRPRAGERTLRTQDIINTIETQGDSIALIFIGGLCYLTGQLFDMPAITRAGHNKNCIVAFDLAHAAGNVPLALHDWNVDFACWCSYKYLNSGPGAVAGCFVHEKHFNTTAEARPRFEGWWGADPDTRFIMRPDFSPAQGADAWQLSNPPIFSLAPVKASLEIFDRVGMQALRKKSLALTAYLESLLDQLLKDTITIITPRDPQQRGAQLSIVIPQNARDTRAALKQQGVICDAREPDVIRLAPTPLYTSYHDCWRCAHALARILNPAGTPAPGTRAS